MVSLYIVYYLLSSHYTWGPTRKLQQIDSNGGTAVLLWSSDYFATISVHISNLDWAFQRNMSRDSFCVNSALVVAANVTSNRSLLSIEPNLV